MFFGSPFYPSSINSVKRMIKLAEPKKNDLILDVGSGDGRIVYMLAKLGYTVHGIEINLFFVIFANLLLFFTRNHKNARVYWANMWKYDMSKYNVIFCYLLPGTLDKLVEKFTKELKPATKIISNTFKISNWKPVKQEDKVYVYKI